MGCIVGCVGIASTWCKYTIIISKVTQILCIYDSVFKIPLTFTYTPKNRKTCLKSFPKLLLNMLNKK